MTIAMCYLSPEGIVLGADSTTSVMMPNNPDGGFHYFNQNQKLFELGENSTLGIVTWGLAGLYPVSYRTLVALLSDDFQANPPKSVREATDRWIAMFNQKYRDWINSPDVGFSALAAKSTFNPIVQPADPNARTEKEEKQYQDMINSLAVGFCLAGYCLPDRSPMAFEIVFRPLDIALPNPRQLIGVASWWGVPNMISRLMNGYDATLQQDILASGKWSGTAQELQDVLARQSLGVSVLPIRDAVDYVHSCILSTIKAMKFSHLSQVCGGPVEIAVITSDRRFRWVRHKPWDAAIEEGIPA